MLIINCTESRNIVRSKKKIYPNLHVQLRISFQRKQNLRYLETYVGTKRTIFAYVLAVRYKSKVDRNVKTKITKGLK